jgi:hypothetical protein
MIIRNWMPWLAGLVLFADAGIGTAAEAAGVKPGRSSQQLMITVLRTTDAAEALGLLNPGNAGETPVHYWGTRRRHEPGRSAQVQVLEGETAFVHLAQTVPDVQLLGVEVRRRRPVPYVRPVDREYRLGFLVQAELAGDKVVLKLNYYNDMPRAESSASSTGQEVRTTVSGHIGQWLDAGGSLDLSRDEGGAAGAARTYSVRHSHEDAARVLVRVELAE